MSDELEPTDTNENGTVLDDPNREAVGLDPVWVEGTGGDAGEGGGDEEVIPVDDTQSSFDPGEHTVSEVEDYVTANPGERQRVTDAEVSGKNRTTLVGWLEG